MLKIGSESIYDFFQNLSKNSQFWNFSRAKIAYDVGQNPMTWIVKMKLSMSLLILKPKNKGQI